MTNTTPNYVALEACRDCELGLELYGMLPVLCRVCGADRREVEPRGLNE